MAVFKVGDRVHYRVYPSGEPDTTIVGEVVRVGRGRRRGETMPRYFVYWEDVSRGTYPPTGYGAEDLAPAEPSKT